MATLERATAMATEAHAGQINRGGQSYILHPLRVMLPVTTPFEQMAAVRHDVVEDAGITLEFLKQEGFPDEVISAADALTKRLGESRMQAALRARQKAMLRQVKLAGNTENIDLSRIGQPTGKAYARLEEYGLVRAIRLESSD